MQAEPSARHAPRLESAYHVARGRFSARTRRLIEDTYELATEWLRMPLEQALDDFAKGLFINAEHTRSGLDQRAQMDSREQLLRGRCDVAGAFVRRIGEALDQLGQRTPPAKEAHVTQPLGLVQRDEHELASALEKVAARGMARGAPLFELSYRLAVLTGTPPLEGAAQPLGPHVLTRAFHAATAALELPLRHQLALLNSFDRMVMQQIAPLYEKINAYLLGDGLLPHLNAYLLPAAPARDAARTQRTDKTREQAQRRAQRDNDSAPAPQHGSNDAPIAVLDNLRELLAQQRGERGAGGSGLAVSTTELESALSALQQHVTDVTEHTGRELRSAQRLRQELVAQLNRNRPADSAKRHLSRAQDDTLELVARLFEQLGHQVQGDGNAHAVLGGLELPVLRMALADEGFFEHPEHPARRLIETITQAADDWLDAPGGDPDRTLRAKLDQVVERASTEPPTAGLYATLLANIEQHLADLKMRAQVAERRHVKAMQGRERLADAHQRADELMVERFTRGTPHGLMRVLLDLAWKDVLTLTLLRHGEEHPRFRAQLAMTDQLLGLTPVTDRTQLTQEVEAGLCQIGMAGEEASQIAQRLVTADAQMRANGEVAPSTTEIVMRLKQNPRLGSPAAEPANAPAASSATPSANAPAAQATGGRTAESAPPDITTAPRHSPEHASPAEAAAHRANGADDPQRPARSPAPANAHEARLNQRLRRLPFGTWLECRDPGSGANVQRKIAWYSTLSGQALLVNRRGQRIEEVALAELARRMAAGRVRILPERRDNLLDRAWRNLTGSLRRARATPPATGGASQ
jgi:hypothetical protein